MRELHGLSRSQKAQLNNVSGLELLRRRNTVVT